jgi:simple sugar transport system ATP-binding protein
MVGRKVTIEHSSGRTSVSDVMLTIKDLKVAMPGERVKGVNLEIRRGEILGIGGLAGQGKLGIANGILGIYPARGEVVLDGKPLPLNQPKQVLSSGIAYVSEDRKGVGLLLNESIELNIAFTAMQIHNSFLKRYGFLSIYDRKAARSNADKQIADLDIRCTSPLQHVGSLSGGNQQKVCVARALSQNPKMLFVSEPTRGIDIGAKKLVLDLLYKLSSESGITIVMTSSELAELRSICDRIAIICEGKVAGILKPDAPAADFGLMMSGSMDYAEKGA